MVQKKKGEGRGREPYTVVVSADADPEGWLRERQKLLTATDIPSVLGVPGARSALETWYQKKDALVARAEAEQIRAAKQAGHDFEDFNALMFAKAAGRRVEREQQLLRSNKHPWLGATLDYSQHMLIVRPGLPAYKDKRPVELKNVGSFAAEEMWPIGGEPHLTWQVQLHVQIIVTDTVSGSLSAWVGAPFVHHRWQDFKRDPKLEEIILDEGYQFWKSLKRSTPPKENPKVTLEVLRRLAPEQSTRKVIDLPPEAVTISRQLLTVQRALDDAQEEVVARKRELDALRGQIAEMIGPNDGGRLPSGDVWSFKHVHVTEHTVAAHSYRKLNLVTKRSSKPRRTTWKTSR